MSKAKMVIEESNIELEGKDCELLRMTHTLMVAVSEKTGLKFSELLYTINKSEKDIGHLIRMSLRLIKKEALKNENSKARI